MHLKKVFFKYFPFSAFSTMFVRYKAVSAIAAQHGEDRWLTRMNVGSMAVGTCSAFGCNLVANFQVINLCVCSCMIHLKKSNFRRLKSEIKTR